MLAARRHTPQPQRRGPPRPCAPRTPRPQVHASGCLLPPHKLPQLLPRSTRAFTHLAPNQLPSASHTFGSRTQTINLRGQTASLPPDPPQHLTHLLAFGGGGGGKAKVSVWLTLPRGSISSTAPNGRCAQCEAPAARTNWGRSPALRPRGPGHVTARSAGPLLPARVGSGHRRGVGTTDRRSARSAREPARDAVGAGARSLSPREGRTPGSRTPPAGPRAPRLSRCLGAEP